MIFVTVGTHEQPFDRLVEYMDKWAKDSNEKVVIQIGFSNYEPEYAEWSRFYGYNEMIEYIKTARIVITHGGPSSFITPIKLGKTPIVVPRQKKYNEHVNDHQLSFCHEVSKRIGNIILIDNINELGQTLDCYDDYVANLPVASCGNHQFFIAKFEKSVEELVN